LFYWFLKFLAIGPLLKLVFRPWAEGTENVPHDGPAILASNHLSYSDWLFMPVCIPRRVTFVAKAEYFESPGIKGWLQKKFFAGSAIQTQLRLLSDGQVCGIYPEGTRSHDGKLYRGRTGVARLALESGAPVIPVAVIATDVVAPPGKIFGKFARPGVRFGQPLDFSRYEGMEDDRFVLRAITDEIMYEIMRLSGQEYVDLYAQDAKKRSREAERAAAKRAEVAAVDEVWREISE
jgi:1-acyl-sn-glycerol-3-phosphate acyltransferase